MAKAASWEWARALGFDPEVLAEAPFREQMVAATMGRCGCSRQDAEEIVDRVAERLSDD